MTGGSRETTGSAADENVDRLGNRLDYPGGFCVISLASDRRACTRYCIDWRGGEISPI